jgi:two-component system OmpR family sensor kinase
MTASLGAVSIIGLLALRGFLDRELNASLLNVASIQASSVTDSPTGAMRFHEWDLTPREAAQVRELNRYAQVWSASGQSLLRTQYITGDLPLDGDALAAAADGELVLAEQRFQGLPIRSLYYPLERMGAAHARHVLQVAAPLTGRNHMLRQLAILLAGITLMTGAASFLGGWWLARRVVRPVHEIIDQAESVRAGTLGRRIRADAETQEYERLITVLNTMLARLESSFEVQRRFTADASHELRSPLTALRGELELALRRERDPAEYRRVIASGLQEVERLTVLVQDLLVLARSDAGMMQPRLQSTDVAERTHAVLGRIAAAARNSRVDLRLEKRGETVLLADPALLEQLVWNLVDNAIRFSAPGSGITVSVIGTPDGVRITVSDSGPGIPSAERERIFERFHRGDEARTASGEAGGTGLGLSIVRAVVEAHGGSISVDDAPGGGARFGVLLPRRPVRAAD